MSFDDPDEQLLRQVHPAFVQDGRLSSQVFHPTKKDDGRLSVSRGSKTTPERSFRHYRDTLGLQSAGVVAVTVAECTRTGIDCEDDPVTGATPDPAHAFLDFRGFEKSRSKAAAKVLRTFAQNRGFLFISDD